MKYDSSAEILLVEDNLTDAELIVRALHRHKLDQRVFIVKDGEEALDYLLQRGRYAGAQEFHLPKVVFLDLKLPKITGLQVLQAVREDERTQCIPVVMLTSSRELTDVRTAYAYGANSYVVKPIDFAAFADTVAQLGLYWLQVNEGSRLQ
ncbi:MAG: response regulator [Candidatus Hydrogenedentes bacterium]|nr:response regulator [Candidatus Hydrogenedentota bacterium]